MNDLYLALLYGAFAGLMIPVGGYLASIERIQPRWLEQEVRHSVMAFGPEALATLGCARRILFRRHCFRPFRSLATATCR